jgi:hypothetical protein
MESFLSDRPVVVGMIGEKELRARRTKELLILIACGSCRAPDGLDRRQSRNAVGGACIIRTSIKQGPISDAALIHSARWWCGNGKRGNLVDEPTISWLILAYRRTWPTYHFTSRNHDESSTVQTTLNGL